jgi:hypothetical protein
LFNFGYLSSEHPVFEFVIRHDIYLGIEICDSGVKLTAGSVSGNLVQQPRGSFPSLVSPMQYVKNNFLDCKEREKNEIPTCL